MVKKRNVTSVAAMGSRAFSAGSVYVPQVLKALLPGPICANPGLIRFAAAPPFARRRRSTKPRAVKH